MDKTQVKAEFFVLSNIFTKEELTKKIGIAPMKSGDKDEFLKSGERREYSFWEISTEYEESLDINEQINKLMPRIEQSKDRIIDIINKKEGEVKFSIVVVIENGVTPAIIINKKMICLANELGAEIEFDTYANPYTSEFS